MFWVGGRWSIWAVGIVGLSDDEGQVMVSDKARRDEQCWPVTSFDKAGWARTACATKANLQQQNSQEGGGS